MSASSRRMVAVAGSVLGAALLSLPPIAGAVDIPAAPKKLTVMTKGSKAKTVFVAKDPAVTKGAGTDVSAIGGTLVLSYDGEVGVFGFAGAYDGTRGWIVNNEKVAKYVNKTAPTGPHTKVALVKPGKLLKLVAKGLGEILPLDILGQGAPTGLGRVSAKYVVTNGGEEYLCAPVSKNGEDPDAVTSIHHLMCLRTKAPRFSGAEVFIDNQFGPDFLRLTRLQELCVPSLKLLPP